MLAWLVPPSTCLCRSGDCINCTRCDGDCGSSCVCFTEITCCCSCPPGRSSRGFGRITCPGGTYQDTAGQELCMVFNNTVGVMFILSVTGAVSVEDCRFAQCQFAGNKACINATRLKFRSSSTCKVAPQDTAFCDKVGIPRNSRTWTRASRGHPAAVGAASAFAPYVYFVSAGLIGSISYRNKAYHDALSGDELLIFMERASSRPTWTSSIVLGHVSIHHFDEGHVGVVEACNDHSD